MSSERHLEVLRDVFDAFNRHEANTNLPGPNQIGSLGANTLLVINSAPRGLGGGGGSNAPVAQDDSYATLLNQALIIAAPDGVCRFQLAFIDRLNA